MGLKNNGLARKTRDNERLIRAETHNREWTFWQKRMDLGGQSQSPNDLMLFQLASVRSSIGIGFLYDRHPKCRFRNIRLLDMSEVQTATPRRG